MKRFGSLLLVCLLASLMLLVGCGDEKVSYDVSQYITLGEYKNGSFTTQDTALTEEEVEAAILAMRTEHATNEVVERAAGEGDIACITYVGYIDGKTFSGGSYTDVAGFDLKLGSGSFIPGFEDQLIGATAGQDVSVNVTFPEDYHTAEYAGKKAVFEVHVISVKEVVLPEYNDDLVYKKLGYESVAAYEEDLREQLAASKVNQIEAAKYQSCWDYALENATVSAYPTERLQAEESNIYNYAYQSWAAQYQSVYTWDEYLALSMGMNSAQFDEYCDTFAKETMTQELLIRAIADAEGIEVSKEDYAATASYYAAMYGLESTEQVEEYMSKETLELMAMYEKVLDILYESATFTVE